MKTLLTVLMIVGLATGCATPLWVKPDYTEESFKRDRYVCLRESTTSGVVGFGGAVIGGAEIDDRLYTACMQARGYTLTYR